MSKDVSLVFGVNVEESTQVIKSQLQGIFEEVNKQPHSIKVAIDGASFNNAISKLQEIRQLMSETDTFRGSGYYLDDISLGINRLRAQLDLMNTNITGAKYNFEIFAQNSLGDITSFTGGISFLNEELIRMRKLLDEISRKEVNFYSGGGGMTGSEAGDLRRAANGIQTLEAGSETLKTTLGEIKVLLSGISTTLSSITSVADGKKLYSETTSFLELLDKIALSVRQIDSIVTRLNLDIGEGNITSSLTNTYNLLDDMLKAMRQRLLDIKTILSKSSTNASMFSDAEEVFKFSEALESIRINLNNISVTLSTVFRDSDGGLISYESHLTKISELLDEISRKEFSSSSYASGGMTYSESDNLESIERNIRKLLEAFGEFKQLLIDISGLISQINSKDFNITNKFAVPKVDNTKKEIALVKQEAVETYRVIEQLISAFETLSKGSHKQELFGALLNNGGQYDNIYSVLTALDQLGTSIDDIQKKQRLDGLNAIKTQLNGLLTDLTNLVSIVNANTNIKILSPDTSALTKAREELDALLKETTAVEDAVRKAALNAMTANPTTTTTTTISANSRASVNESINTVTNDLNNIKSQVDTFVADTNEKLSRMLSLSDTKTSTMRVTVFANEIKSIIDSMISEINIKLNGLFEIQKLSGISEQVGGYISKIQTEFDSLKAKVIEGIAEIQTALNSITMPQITTSGLSLDGIKESLSALKTEISSVMTEVKSAIDTTLGSIDSSKVALPVENIKEYLTVLESIQGAHSNMGEVAAQFKGLSGAIQGLSTEAFEKVSTEISKITTSLDTLNTSVSDILKSLGSLSVTMSDTSPIKTEQNEIETLTNDVKALFEAVNEYANALSSVRDVRITDPKNGSSVQAVDSITRSYLGKRMHTGYLSGYLNFHKLSNFDYIVPDDKLMSKYTSAIESGSKENLESLKSALSEYISMYKQIIQEYNTAVKSEFGKDTEKQLGDVSKKTIELGNLLRALNDINNSVISLNNSLSQLSKSFNSFSEKSIPIGNLEKDSMEINRYRREILALSDDVQKLYNNLFSQNFNDIKVIDLLNNVIGSKSVYQNSNSLLRRTAASQSNGSTIVQNIGLPDSLVGYNKTLSKIEDGLINDKSTLVEIKQLLLQYASEYNNIIQLYNEELNKQGLDTKYPIQPLDVSKYLPDAKSTEEAILSAKELKSIISQLSKIDSTAKSGSKSKSKVEEIKEEVAAEKELAEAEKVLADAAAAEGQAEEGRKISLSQFLTLYTKLLDLQNKGTHLSNTDNTEQYQALTDSINTLMPVYDMYKDKTENIENIIKGAEAAEIDLAKAFDAGTIAAKQFEAAIPNSSDGVKIQNVLKTIGNANSVISKYNDAKGDKGNQSYVNLINLVAKLDSKVNQTRDGFKELGTETIDAGDKISEIMRRIAVEVENVRNETAKTVAANKSNEDVFKSKTYSTLTSLTSVMASAKNKSSALVDSDSYKAVEEMSKAFKQVIRTIETDGVKAEEAFRRIGRFAEVELSKAQIASYALKAEINETSKEATTAEPKITALLKAWESLNKSQKLINKNSALKNTDAYSELTKNVSLLTQVIDYAEKNNVSFTESLNVLKLSGDKIFEDLKISISKFNLEAMKTPLTLKQVRDSLTEMQNLINRSANTKDSQNTAAYEQLKNVALRTKRAIELVTDDIGVDLGRALEKWGFNASTYLTECADVTSAFKVELSAAAGEAKRIGEATRNTNKELKESQALLNKVQTLNNKMQSALSKWGAAKAGKTSNQYSAIANDARELETLTQRYKNGEIELKKFKAEVDRLSASFNNNSQAIIAAGENTKSLSERFGNFSRYFGMWFGFSRIIMQAISSIKQMINTSIELDDAFTQLQIVTQSTESSYEKFGNTVAQVAKRTATSMADITSSATTFARLGFSLEESAQIAEYTAMLQNVGDIDVSDAQDAITAILKAYGMGADKMEEIMDKLVTTGNHFPISVSQIAEGMNNASSALAAAGNSFDQSVALLTAANVTIQDAAKSSTALRTIAARIRKTDTELDELGESMSSSKYDSLIKSLSGLNIALVDANNEYRSTYDILSDIASKWNSLSTMEQSALAETIAGTRQQAVFFSIIEQFQEASGAMDAMAGSAGTLETAYETYLDSTTAHINQFKAAFEELSATTFNSKLLSNIVDLGTAFTGFVNTLTKFKLIIPTIAIGVLIPKLIKLGQAAAAEDLATKKLITTIVTKGKLEESEIAVLNAMDVSERNLIQTELQRLAWSGKLSEAQYAQIYNEFQLINANNALASSNETVALSFASVAAEMPGWGWALIAITGVVAVMGAAINKAEEMKKAFHENTEQIRDNIKSLEDFKKKVDDIYNSDSTDKLKEYNELRQDIIDSYDTHIDKITDEAEAVDILNKKLDEEIARKRDLYLLDTEEQYNMVKKYSSDFGKDEGNFWSDIWRKLTTDPGKSQDWRDINITNPTSTTSKEAAQISDNILKLFDSGSTNLWDKATFSIGKKAKNEVELLKIIEDAYLKFGDIKDARESVGGSLTEGEELLFESLKDQYNGLKEHLGESGIDYESALERASVMVDKLVSKFPQGTKSLEEWEASLIKNANGDELVIDKIKEMIAALRELNQEVKVDSLDELTEILETFKGQLEQVNETISTASDYFDDLAKVIDKNKEIDKFFTADEMIDMLDKYPELNDNVLVTAYGYKFEAEALEELRKAKLEEQKTDIETKLKEIKASKDKAEAKFIEYQSELRGISTVAEAEAELALVEQQLNDSTFKQGGYIANQLEEKRAKLAGYIEVSKNIRKLSQEYDKSVMQYTLLGNVFDDLKDSTNDATKALNNQKAALKDLADEYKDAKDAIEDLIKLTMDMIKKTKSLEKEALKEQLEGFKKLIDKRKELIDLEKDYIKHIVRYYWKRWYVYPLELLEYRKVIYTTT